MCNMLIFKGGYYFNCQSLPNCPIFAPFCPIFTPIWSKNEVSAVTNQGRFLFLCKTWCKRCGYNSRAVSNQGRFVLETLRYFRAKFQGVCFRFIIAFNHLVSGGFWLSHSTTSASSRDWVIKNETESFKIEKITAISFSVINIVIVSHHEVS